MERGKCYDTPRSMPLILGRHLEEFRSGGDIRTNGDPFKFASEPSLPEGRIEDKLNAMNRHSNFKFGRL